MVMNTVWMTCFAGFSRRHYDALSGQQQTVISGTWYRNVLFHSYWRQYNIMLTYYALRLNGDYKNREFSDQGNFRDS